VALRAAMEAGFVQDISQDDFFASIRDSEEFKAGFKELMMARAQKEIAEAESFAFDFTLPGLDGNPVKLADFKGKLVIADIWGTWCPPCRAEIPHFIKLQETYPNDLAIVGLNYEGEEGEEVVEKIRTFATEQGINYPLVIGDQATQDQVPEFGGFPTTLFIDREGKVRLKIVGLHPYDMLDAYVSVLLAEPGTSPGAGSDAAGSDAAAVETTDAGAGVVAPDVP
jgi:thiol-disulfide isomerase/thioredoxin